MPDIIFLKLASAILLVVFVYTFAFWFGYEKGTEDKQISKEKLDKEIENRVRSLCTCPNEIDVILHVIFPDRFYSNSASHYETNCCNKKCHLHPVSKNDELPKNFSPEARALYEEIMRGASTDARSSKGKGSFTATLSPKMESFFDDSRL